ncbi:uncharacterized protein LOC131001662 [Salvia miltiorrhiza]|uniref:uncharacterized protein LOC131001662 n=1 Tax=Salvia miltiorrhiza TaxID=226208 RepID=UPI0025ABEA53|nr:uncharacterized protein LOC131001662 [Salvia miltiorrhiza]
MADFKPQLGHRDTNTRRFSASNWKSFREDERSTLRSSTTISSTVSSPGYTTSEKIDPSTYSFTAALKALQTRSMWSSERVILHSKWSDAEKYISNPVSGQVPLECLSARNRITISAPIILHHKLNITIQEKNKSAVTRDVGTQSVPSAPPTPSIQERRSEAESSVDSSLSTQKDGPQLKVERERNEKEGLNRKEGRERKKMVRMMCSQGVGRRGCLQPLKGLWQRRNKCNCKPRKNINPSSSPTLLYHINACYDV